MPSTIFAVSIVSLLVLGCSRDETQDTTGSMALTHEGSPREEKVREYIAILEHAEPVTFKEDCFGLRPGEVELSCDLAHNSGFKGFKESLVGGVEQVLRTMKAIPELKGKVHLQINVEAHGWADGLPFSPESQCKMRHIYNLYQELAPSFNHTPIENHPGNWNLILALTRAMVALDEARRQLAQPLVSIDGAADVVKPTWEVKGTETSLVGAKYRGATLSAAMVIRVPQGIHAVQVVASLEGRGWQVQRTRLPGEEK